jgi:hypothetical protein
MLFRQRSVPYDPRTGREPWDYLFMMQHSGVPTRLLDWTENAFIALYFALTGAVRAASGNTVGDAAVWLLSPKSWNRGALHHMSFAGDILSAGDAELNSYFPVTDPRLMGNEAVGLYGPHNTARIVAQRGVFTIFGKSMEPMENAHSHLTFEHTSLVKAIIPGDRVKSMLKSLRSVGFTETVVFPDLDGLARELKSELGFD